MTGQPGRSGGARQGVQGKAYANRTDLMTKQRTAAPIPSGGGGSAPPPAPPGAVSPIPLDAPSQRPGEHVMTGTAAGPGPGPLSSGLVPAGGSNDTTVEALRAIYAAYPNPDLARLLETIDGGDYSTAGLYGARL